MSGQFLDLEAPDGNIPAYLVDPGGEPRPGVVILHEIFGVNDAMRDEAERWAAEGYIVLVPDLFHRQQEGAALDYTPEGRDIALQLWAGLDLAKAIRDAEAACDWLKTSSRCAGRVASVGFCLGGKLSVLAGNRFDANVAFYPVQLQTHRLEIDRLDSPIMLHVGTADPHIPYDVIDMLETTIGTRPQCAVKRYEGAEHAFYNGFRPAGFAPDAARTARASTSEFLAKHLRGVR